MRMIVLLFAFFLSSTVFAMDKVVKESASPPPAAEAPTPFQLQPLITGAQSIAKPATAPIKKSELDDPMSPQLS